MQASFWDWYLQMQSWNLTASVAMVFWIMIPGVSIFQIKRKWMES